VTITVCSDRPELLEYFQALDRSGSFSVEQLSVAGLDHGSFGELSMVYLDVAGFERAELRRLLHRLHSAEVRFAILDIERTVEDIAELFYLGACDYVDERVLSVGLSNARIRRALAFREGAEPAATDHPSSPAPREVQGPMDVGRLDWDTICDGSEYRFVMLYAGVDPITGKHRESTDRATHDSRTAFKDLVSRYVAPIGGRVYMWKEEEGILLFPYHEENTEPANSCFRMMLNKVILNADHLSRLAPVTWRLALHVGSTTYRSSGDTATVVSEAVNHLFHIGSGMPKDSFYVTGDALLLVPDGLRPFFVSEGSFEQSRMYKMYLPGS
jgi:hypothetical protein